MVSLAVTHGLVEAIEAGGGNPDDVLATLKLTRAGLATPHGFIPSSAFAQGLEEAALATGDDTFGLHFGERYQPKNLGPLTYVVIHSPTIAVALENIGRYIRVHNEAAESSVVIDGTWVLARLRLSGLTVAVPRQQHEFAMAAALNTFRLMAGTDWVPAEVQFAHPVPRSTVEHVRVFRAPVYPIETCTRLKPCGGRVSDRCHFSPPFTDVIHGESYERIGAGSLRRDERK